ncbi:uncharacterized protein LOC143891751 [Tasmannia lanceolata]|uniref:uncharacterized protein LOC143891751 n=1 Tax=Tasmannia lanceolata TaxID=3420 RepID=UPI0040639763
MAESNEMLAEMRDMMRNLTREVSTLKEEVTQLKSERTATSKQPVVQNPPNVIPGLVQSVISPENDFYDEQYIAENCLPQSVKPGKEKELVDRVEKLTQQVESMQVKGPKKINMSDFSLFPGVTLPPKFRMPDFDKYDGTGCPWSHLRSFISNLEGYGLSPEQIAKVFPMSLTGVAKKWFLHLKPEELGTLDEIANKFVEQFSMEEGIEVTKRDLKAIKQGPQETFTSFVRRWRRKAAQMTNRPSEEDQIKIVVKNLSPQYYHFMATQYYSDFNHLIKTGTITEDALLKGSLAKSSFDPRNGKKPMVVSKPEVSNVVAAHPMRRVVAETEQPMRKAPRHFDPLPYPLSVALKKLLRDKKITLLEPKLPPPILPRYWREDQHCAYHQGTGHLTDNCMALRHKIQDMIEAKKIAVFMPNTTRNPLPAHAPRPPPTVGAVFTEEPILDPASLICAIASDSPTVLAFGDEVEEVEEEKPYVLGGDEDDYAESSVGPYILQCDEEEVADVAPYVLSFDDDDFDFLNDQCDEVRHVTRGGRIFKPAELRAENPAEVVRAAEAQKQSKSSCEEEDESLLRQLKKTQANISIWGLLMASPKHRQVVLRELNAAQVSVDITSDELVGLVAMARVSKTLSFTDEDLTSEGHNHTRPLKITVICNGKKVPDVLVDNGSALNVCPLATATVLGFEPNDFIPSEQGILAYDGTRRDVIGTLATEVLIGGEIFEVEFQKLKFIRNNRVITVKGDPDLEVGQISQEGTSEKKGDVSLTGFSVEVTAISFEKAKNEEILFLTSTNPRVVKMMHKQGYLPGAGLGRNHQGIVEWPIMRKNEGLFGLGYEPSSEEIREMRNYMRKWSELRRRGLELPMKSFSLIRNGKYRREGDDFAFCGFAEPWVDELTGQELPGFEIFFDMELPDEYPSLQIHEIEPEVDWADILEPCLLNSLFQVELPIVAMIGGDALILDPESLITPAEGPLTNWSSQVIPRVVIQYSPVSIKESVVSSYMSISESKIEFALSDVSFDAGTVVIEPVDEESFDAVVQSDAESIASSVESIESVESVDSVHTIVQSDDESVKISKDFNTEPIEGASTDRAATTLLHDMIHKEVEVYVDDMIVKAKTREEHAGALRKFFQRIQKFKLRLNPNKCVFGVTSGKLLGFLVSRRGIEVDPQKIKAIQEMAPPKTEKQIRGFLGKVQYLRRFIAQLTTTCEPIFKLLKKNAPKKWNEECQEAFEKIKQCLALPPVLSPIIPGQPMLLYLSVTDTAMGCMLAQQDPESKRERAIYYVSKKMLEYEQKYTILEKTCLALVWATQKLRHYLLSSRVLLLSRMDPLKYLFEKPALTGRTARWLLLLSEFDITYVTQKSIKGRVIAEQLADSPAENNEFLKAEFPDEEIMTVEDEDLDVFGDSILIICQTNGNWKTRDDKLIPYNTYLESLVRKFGNITFTHLSRTKNHFADALATLASMLDISATMEVQPLEVRLQWAPSHVNAIEIAARCPDGRPWYTDIKNLILGKGHPPEASGKERRSLQKLAANFVICGEELYRRSFDGIQLLCIDEDQAAELIEQTHEGKEVARLCEEFKIKHHKSSPYRPQTNGAVEAANKNIKVIISKMTETYKDWSSKLPYALWAYRTSIRSSTGATPYSLVYGMEAVLPVELRIPSLRVMMEAGLPESDWAQARYHELQMIDEKRLKALYHVQGYQRRVERAFNKKVRVRDLKKGDLVLKSFRAPDTYVQFDDLIERFSKNVDPIDSRFQNCRRSALIFGVLARHVVREDSSIAPVTLLSVADQISEGRNPVPIMLAETFSGLDLIARQEVKDNFHGSLSGTSSLPRKSIQNRPGTGSLQIPG